MAKPISSSQLTAIISESTGYEPGESGSGERIPEVRDTRRVLRPSTRKMQKDCVSVEESIQLAAGKTDLAEELFSMLLEQLPADLEKIEALWTEQQMEPLLECVHKLHGATRYCGVPELRSAANQLETALKRGAADIEAHKNQLVSAIERLQIWSEQTDWQQLFREQPHPEETTS